MHHATTAGTPELAIVRPAVRFSPDPFGTCDFVWERRRVFVCARPSPRAETMGPTLGPISVAKIQHRDPGTLLLGTRVAVLDVGPGSGHQ